MMRFPYGRQSIDDSDLEAIKQVLFSTMLTQGPKVAEFERAFESSVNARNAVAVANGTAALQLAYQAAGLGPDAGLICPAVTFLATAAAARVLGATVAFADVDPNTGLMTADTLRSAFERANFPVRAVACVHLCGRICDLRALKDVCDEYGALLIEDACHAPGASVAGEQGKLGYAGACELSDFAAFSFHPVKHIAMGEGGMVCCKNRSDAERIARLRTHGIDRNPDHFPDDQETGPWTYVNTEIGWNYRLTDLQAAMGISQLQKFWAGVDKRRMLVSRYLENLSELNSIQCPPMPEYDFQHSWHLFAPAIDFNAIGMTRGALMKSLSDRGIGSQVHYIPLYRQPTYQEAGSFSDYSGAEYYYSRTLSIPLYPDLSLNNIDEISDVLIEILSQ